MSMNLISVKDAFSLSTKVVSISTGKRTTADWFFILKQLETDSRCVDKSALTAVDCLGLFVFSTALHVV